MADTKISQLPAYPSGVEPLPGDIIPIVDTSAIPYVTRQIPFALVSVVDFSAVPLISFTGSLSGGTGQSFTDASLTLYTATGQPSVFVDGVLMSQGANYNLLGAQLNFLDYLPPSANIEVIFKLIPSSTAVNDITLQNGVDTLVDQLDNSLITQ